jgi:hypothetical protein
VPTFEGNIGAPTTFADNDPYRQGQRFNDFMTNNVHKTVYLFLFLDEEQTRDFARGFKNPDEYNRIYFYVKNDYSRDEMGNGNEYLVHLPVDRTKWRFEWLEKAGRLAGYFRIWCVSGPRQGSYSVNLRPVEEFNE